VCRGFQLDVESVSARCLHLPGKHASDRKKQLGVHTGCSGNVQYFRSTSWSLRTELFQAHPYARVFQFDKMIMMTEIVLGETEDDVLKFIAGHTIVTALKL
jgi:hypothetical protein